MCVPRTTSQLLNSLLAAPHLLDDDARPLLKLVNPREVRPVALRLPVRLRSQPRDILLARVVQLRLRLGGCGLPLGDLLEGFDARKVRVAGVSALDIRYASLNVLPELLLAAGGRGSNGEWCERSDDGGQGKGARPLVGKSKVSSADSRECASEL